MASVVVTPSTPTLVSLGETTQLTASALDENDNPISGKAFTWMSSDEGVATVSESGLVTAVANGEVTVMAETDGVSGNAEVEVRQAPAQLAFVVEPATTLAGMVITPGVEIEIRDALANLVADAEDDVTLAIGTNPSGGSLMGTTTVSATNGIAAFLDLTIDLGGRDYTLQASIEDLTESTSAPFNILSGLPASVIRAVSPGVSILGLGTTHDLQLDADDSNGDPTLPPATTWTSLNEDVATVASLDPATGRVTAHRDGQVTLVADAIGMSAEILVTVSVPGPGDPGTVDWDVFNSNTFYDVFATSDDDIWVVGTSGTILHYDGSGWVDVTPGLTTNDLYSVWASGPTDVWAVGMATALHYDGSEWVRSEYGFAFVLNHVWGTAPDNVWVAGRDGFGMASLVHFDGTAWTDVTSALPGEPEGLEGMWGSGPNDIWVGEATGKVFGFDGTSWNETGPPGLDSEVRDIFGSSSSNVWLIADEAAWQFDGTQWIDRTAGLTFGSGEWLRSGWTGGPTSAWVVPTNSQGTAWHYDGSGWTADDVPWGVNGANAMAGTASNNLWAVTNWGEIAHYDGVGWTNQTLRETTASLFGMWGSSPDDVWAAGAEGVIMHFDGNGWNEVPAPFNVQLYDVWGSGSEDVWAVGWSGDIFHFNGVNWSDVGHGATSSVLRGVWGSSPNDVWAVGDDGAVLHYNGADWTLQSTAFQDIAFRGIWGSSARDIWVVGADGTNGAIVHYDGEEWSDRTPSGTVLVLNDVWGTGPDDLWVVGEGDMLLHFDGLSWLNQVPGRVGHFQEVWGTGTQDVWALGGANGCCPRHAVTLFHYDGVGWSDVTPGLLSWSSIHSIWGSRSSPIWLWGAYGMRMRVVR